MNTALDAIVYSRRRPQGCTSRPTGRSGGVRESPLVSGARRASYVSGVELFVDGGAAQI
jgi:hypothetical protein